MQRVFLLFLGFVFAVLVTVSSAQAAKRVALIIGNNNYAHLPKLNNASKDATDLAQKLRQLGFDVIHKNDAKRRDMYRLLKQFSGKLSQGATAGLFFYAGHGIQADNKNFLVPVDAELQDEDDLLSDALDSDLFLQRMASAGVPLSIVILDACRNNPLPTRRRSATRGLAITAFPTNARGTAILYAAGQGQTALDGKPGENGLFTGALLRHLDKPGWSLNKIFQMVGKEVFERSGGKQRPWQLVSMQNDFFFTEKITRKPGRDENRDDADRPALRRGSGECIDIWNAIKDSDDLEVYKAFIDEFPKCRMARFARIRLRKLKRDAEEAAKPIANKIIRTDPSPDTLKVDPVKVDPPKETVKETKLALLVPPKEPEIPLTPVEASYITLRAANVRAAPSVNAKKVLTLAKGTEVYVPGMTKNGKWLQVERDRVILGYVFSRLLKDKFLHDAATKEASDIRRIRAEEAKRADLKRADLKRSDADRRRRMREAAAKYRREADQRQRLEESAKKDRLAREERRRKYALLQKRQAPKRRPDFSPGYGFTDCSGCPKMIVLPAGSFIIGATDNEIRLFKLSASVKKYESPRKRIYIQKFAVGRFEVTRGQFSKFLRETGVHAPANCRYYSDKTKKWASGKNYSWRNPGYRQSDSHPVVCIDWEDAKAYTRWLSRKTGKKYRLLSEGEWEYTARAGSSTSHFWGNDTGSLGACRFANGADRSYVGRVKFSCTDRYKYTAPVGSFRPNPFGVYDLSGNVWEWLEDCRSASHAGIATNGQARRSGDCTKHMARGGSFRDGPSFLRSAKRVGNARSYRGQNVGFRVARDIR